MEGCIVQSTEMSGFEKNYTPLPRASLSIFSRQIIRIKFISFQTSSLTHYSAFLHCSIMQWKQISKLRLPEHASSKTGHATQWMIGTSLEYKTLASYSTTTRTLVMTLARVVWNPHGPNVWVGFRAFHQSIRAWDTSFMKNMKYCVWECCRLQSRQLVWLGHFVCDRHEPHVFRRNSLSSRHWCLERFCGDWHDLYYVYGCFSLRNQDISAWDTSLVTSMSLLFIPATSFNQDMSAWNVAAVTDMYAMFDSASSFIIKTCALGRISFVKTSMCERCSD